MEDLLQRIGLNNKEAKLYLFLLRQPQLTAARISEVFGETRTNTYTLLASLETFKLVQTDTTKPVKSYRVISPTRLRQLVGDQQRASQETAKLLAEALPHLNSVFKLNQHRPGIVYFEGLEGYIEFQEDIANAKIISIFGSNSAPDHELAWEAMQIAVQKRFEKGTKARLLLHTDARKHIDENEFKHKRGYELKFWGDKPFDADIVIYDDKVGITSYEDALITTVISNELIADTFKTIFDTAWNNS